ncbi:hypothetical protein FDUTEX481_05595 [Tolypothrix sp. PCC 7601]|nr:hypothetical protein FDUTEX481_05595 [Tolypothrix sp. PCC 7601]
MPDCFDIPPILIIPLPIVDGQAGYLVMTVINPANNWVVLNR